MIEHSYQVSVAVSVLLFFFYGLSVLFSDGMVEEFERFGLSRFRRLTGALEVLGAIGLLVGYFVPVLMVAAASGLAILMVLGLATRIRVRDRLFEMLPAAILLVVTIYILSHAVAVVRAA